MNQKIFYWAIAVFAILTCSCEKDNSATPLQDKLVGSWQGESGDCYRFMDDGTYTFFTLNKDGHWIPSDDIYNRYFLSGNEIQLNRIEPRGKAQTFTYVVDALSDNAMIWHIKGAESTNESFGKVASPIIGTENPHIIFDSDLGNSTDDVFALHALFMYQSRGLCTLVGAMQSRKVTKAKDLFDRFLHYYHGDNIPLGLVEGEEQFFEIIPYYQLADSLKPDGTPLFEPTGIPLPQRLPAWKLYRKLLSEADDNSISIVCVGMFTNLGLLLESGADDYSPLTGKELVRQKVKSLDVMCGMFSPVALRYTDKDGATRFLEVEYNISGDIPLAKKTVEEWPGEIHIFPLEEGMLLPSIHDDILMGFSTQPYSPIYQIYSHYDEWETGDVGQYMWDYLCTLHAILPESYFNCSANGFLSISEDGKTTFEEDEDGNCHIISLNFSSQKLMWDIYSKLPSFVN